MLFITEFSQSAKDADERASADEAEAEKGVAELAISELISQSLQRAVMTSSSINKD